MNILSTHMRRHSRAFWALPGIMFLAALVYANSLKSQFVWDDHWVIVENDFIKSAGNLPHLFTKQYLTSPQEINSVRVKSIGSGEFTYRPLVTATYFIDYRIWKLNPFGFHLTNLLLHLINILIFYFLALRILGDEKTALLSAALFALHPVNAEAVNVATHREDLLAFLFFSASVLLFLRAHSGPAEKRHLLQGGSIVFFLFALFSKEMAITLPAVLVLYDYFFTPLENPRSLTGFTFRRDYRGLFRQCVGRYAGYIIAAACYWFIWGIIFKNSATGAAYTGLRFPLNIAVPFFSFARAAYWFFCPWAVHPTLRGDDLRLFMRSGATGAICSALLLAAFLAWAFRMRKRSPVISFSLLYVCITLLPVLNLVPMLNVSASRFLYIPAAGFCLLVPAVLKRLPGKVSAYLFLILIAGYAVITPLKNLTWKNDHFLGLRLVETYPDSAEAHGVLGSEYLKEGFAEQAVSEYQKAVSLDPYKDRYYNGLGLSYYRAGDFDSAIEQYKKAVSLNPSSPGFFTNLAIACKEKGLYTEAIGYLESALSIDPRFTLALDNLGTIYKETGNAEQARILWERSLEIYPSNPNALNALRTLGK